MTHPLTKTLVPWGVIIGSIGASSARDFYNILHQTIDKGIIYANSKYLLLLLLLLFIDYFVCLSIYLNIGFTNRFYWCIFSC